MMDEKEGQFLDEEEMLDDEEKFYAEMFERLMEYAYPNPDRIPFAVYHNENHFGNIYHARFCLG
jgi:hypothetical protein